MRAALLLVLAALPLYAAPAPLEKRGPGLTCAETPDWLVGPRRLLWHGTEYDIVLFSNGGYAAGRVDGCQQWEGEWRFNGQDVEVAERPLCRNTVFRYRFDPQTTPKIPGPAY